MGFVLLMAYTLISLLTAWIARPKRRKQWIRWTVRALGGIGLLFGWNLLANWEGFRIIGVNSFTLVVSLVLGLPGIADLVAVHYGLS